MIEEIDLPIIVDAGIGSPSQACEAMEMGAAAIMANTAIATSGNVTAMASAFAKAIEAGKARIPCWTRQSFRQWCFGIISTYRILGRVVGGNQG